MNRQATNIDLPELLEIVEFVRIILPMKKGEMHNFDQGGVYSYRFFHGWKYEGIG